MTGIIVLKRLRRILLGVGVVFATLPVGSALADTTIGQAEGSAICTPLDGATFADTNYAVSAGGGTITSFSVLEMSAFGNPGEQLDFLALRPVTGGTYAVVGKTGLVTLTGTGFETFPANIPVHAGDILGYWSNAFGLNNCLRPVTSGGGVIVGSGPATDPSAGDTFDLNFSDPTFDLNESANLVTTPPNKDACKDGGWQTYTDGQGQPFKNQGQCVAWADHNT